VDKEWKTLQIQEIHISEFRNLKEIHYLSTTGINAFFGANAQGKSNLLEAIYTALRGESFRYYSSKKDWLSADNQCLGTKVSIQSNQGIQHQVELRHVENKFFHFLDEKKISSNKLKEKHPIVVFSPDDHNLIRGEPDYRRNFVENVLCDGIYGFASHLADYQKALSNRNALLKQIRERGLSEDSKKLLEAWSLLLTKEGIKILELRNEYWPEFLKTFQRVIHSLFVTSPVDIQWKTFKTLPTYEEYLNQLRQSYEKDLVTGWTHFGPHREDMEIMLNVVPARNSASQGQARILALALRWSHAEWIEERTQEKAVFFVDDFSSELDERHRKALMERLIESKGQVFLTGTNESFLESKLIANTHKAYIVNGRIS
jgi:DNA replication and repair protein RecF